MVLLSRRYSEGRYFFVAIFLNGASFLTLFRGALLFCRYSSNGASFLTLFRGALLFCRKWCTLFRGALLFCRYSSNGATFLTLFRGALLFFRYSSNGRSSVLTPCNAAMRPTTWSGVATPFSKRERVWSAYVYTSTCARHPESWLSNQVAEKPIIAFLNDVTSRYGGMCNAGTCEKWRSMPRVLPLKACATCY